MRSVIEWLSSQHFVLAPRILGLFFFFLSNGTLITTFLSKRLSERIRQVVFGCKIPHNKKVIFGRSIYLSISLIIISRDFKKILK